MINLIVTTDYTLPGNPITEIIADGHILIPETVKFWVVEDDNSLRITGREK